MLRFSDIKIIITILIKVKDQSKRILNKLEITD